MRKPSSDLIFTPEVLPQGIPRVDAHIHTTFSDGHDTVGAVLAAAVACGLSCVALTDHVRRSTDWFPRYVKEVRRVAGSFPQLTVYVGVEAGDQATLDFMNKESTVDAGKRSLELLAEHDLVSETSFVLGLPDETPERVKATLELAKAYDPDFAHFLAIAPWPYAPMWKDLERHVVSRDYRRYNLVDPVVKPEAMTLDEVDAAIVDCYRSFYMDKAHRLLKMPPGFRRDYDLRSMKLIMSSSFVRKKMLGAAIPHDVRTLLDGLARGKVGATGD